MEKDKTTKQTKRKKRRRVPSQDEYVRYVVAIEDWDWSYSFGLAGRKDSFDPYMEHRQLAVTGKLLHPTNLSIQSVELWFLPTDDLDEDKRKDHTPKAVGTLSLHDGRLTGLLSIPKDALNPVNRCPTVIATTAEVERFEREFVSLFALARQQGRHHMAAKKDLEAAGVKPAFDPETIGGNDLLAPGGCQQEIIALQLTDVA